MQTSSSFRSEGCKKLPRLPLALAVTESTSPESIASRSISATLLLESTIGFRSSELTRDIGNTLPAFSPSKLFIKLESREKS
uniref:ATM n=1 Tax=Arundo donax TaxID=35708 RepID=A0A0A9CXI1_ARUDO